MSAIAPSRLSRGVRQVAAASAILASVGLTTVALSPPASAASGAHVLVGANARSCTQLSSCLLGTVKNDGSGPNYQVSDMSCWWNGDWYNGSNRWFQVYVTLNSGVTRWAFVHSAFVPTQPVVGQCNSGNMGG
ncbi:hypothetical protein GQ649_29555 [Rhodococcus sp. DSM 6344]|nr:hypothetical protein [Rhodococcus erythropolis]